MRILTVTLGFYPALSWGGPVKIVYQNSRELIRRGHHVTIYCSNLMNKKQKIRPGTFEGSVEGIRIVYFNTWNLPWWPGTLGPFWLPDLPAYLKREVGGYDVVHLVGYRSSMTLLSAMAARKAGIPIITQPQGTLPVIANMFLPKRMYDRLLGRMELKGVSALIALQQSERRQALSRGIPSERVEMIPNGIDPGEIEGLPEPGTFRRRYGLASDRPLILFLGRINRIKGTDMLVRAFAKLTTPGIQLAIVGPDDGQLAEVRRLIHEFALSDRVVLPGLISDADKLAAFRDADLFVLPSRSDAYPTTVMESCLAGKPMVVSDRCEMADIVRDRVADVVPFDADAFAGAMQRLLTDEERYERYKSNCAQLLSDTFSISAVVDRLETTYQRVVAEKKAAFPPAGYGNAGGNPPVR